MPGIQIAVEPFGAALGLTVRSELLHPDSMLAFAGGVLVPDERPAVVGMCGDMDTADPGVAFTGRLDFLGFSKETTLGINPLREDAVVRFAGRQPGDDGTIGQGVHGGLDTPLTSNRPHRARCLTIGIDDLHHQAYRTVRADLPQQNESAIGQGGETRQRSGTGRVDVTLPANRLSIDTNSSEGDLIAIRRLGQPCHDCMTIMVDGDRGLLLMTRTMFVDGHLWPPLVVLELASDDPPRLTVLPGARPGHPVTTGGIGGDTGLLLVPLDMLIDGELVTQRTTRQIRESTVDTVPTLLLAAAVPGNQHAVPTIGSQRHVSLLTGCELVQLRASRGTIRLGRGTTASECQCRNRDEGRALQHGSIHLVLHGIHSGDRSREPCTSPNRPTALQSGL